MQIKIKNSAAMQKLGAAIASVCEQGTVIYLHGELGAGKTTLVRGFLRKLGFKGHVRSPTFTLLEPYQFADRFIYHFDLYRLISPEEFMHIGGRDYFTEQNTCLVEWPENGKGFLPLADLTCNFIIMGKERKVMLIGNSIKGKNIINRIKKLNLEF